MPEIKIALSVILLLLLAVFLALPPPEPAMAAIGPLSTGADPGRLS